MKTISSRVEQGFSPALKDRLERRLFTPGVHVVLQGRTTLGAEARILPALPCRPEGLLHPIHEKCDLDRRKPRLIVRKREEIAGE